MERRRLRFVVGILLVAVLVAIFIRGVHGGKAPAESPLEGETIYARILIVAGGNPVSGATVMLQDGGTHITGPAGSTTFLLDANRCYLGWVFARGYPQKRISICTGDTNASFTVALSSG